MTFDTIIQNGTLYDGLGSPARLCSVGIRDGRIEAISDTALPENQATKVIDATGKWITPGFIDFHTHYDAELEMSPELSESVRHGVTTIFLGSCSLGASLGSPEDIADIFCRVEGVPRSVMLPIMQERKNWNTLPGYLEHLESLPLGPNVSSFVGHSNLRMHVMGFDRSVQNGVRPTKDEMKTMERLLNEGLDAGYIGMSVQTLPWDKLDGDRWRSQPLPSYFASWREYRKLTKILRRRDRIFQGVPNVTTKVNVLQFLRESTGVFRKPLKTTIISLMDLRYDRTIHRFVPWLSRFFNKFLRADFRFQALPNLFDLWADGMDLVIFEEFAAGTEALHISDADARHEMINEPAYRARFKKDWNGIFKPKVYHRNFKYTDIIECPDQKYVGRSFDEIAEEREQDPVDVYLDLVHEFGNDLRWYSVMANDRLKPLEGIVSQPDVLIGFSDAGAHLRNMAHYNFPLRMLKLVRDAQNRGEAFMTTEHAVFRLTGEIATWFGIDAGVLAEGKRADLVVIDPEMLNEDLERAQEAPMERFGGLVRLVRRNPKTVNAVFINGKQAVEDGEPTKTLGRERGFGTVLRAVG